MFEHAFGLQLVDEHGVGTEGVGSGLVLVARGAMDGIAKEPKSVVQVAVVELAIGDTGAKEDQVFRGMVETGQERQDHGDTETGTRVPPFDVHDQTEGIAHDFVDVQVRVELAADQIDHVLVKRLMHINQVADAMGLQVASGVFEVHANDHHVHLAFLEGAGFRRM